MRVLNVLLLGSLLFLGCGPKENNDQMPERYSQQEKNEKTTLVAVEDEQMNIGDVESHIYMSGILSTDVISDSIRVNTTSTKKDRIAITTVDVYPPYPETLSVHFVVFSRESFVDSPIVVRAKVLREKDVLGDFATIMTSRTGDELKPDTPIFTFNAFADLDTLPETMLIHAQAEVLLSNLGTKIESIDPQTFDVDDLMHKTILLSSPIRINIHKEAPPAAPEQ